VHDNSYRFEIGRASVLRDGGDVTLVAIGTMVCRALEAAEQLSAEGFQATVVNMATVRPIDRDALCDAAARTGAVVTVEEHSVHGGLGSAVAEVLSQQQPVPMRIIGVPGVFPSTGSHSWLCEHFGLTAAGIRNAAAELVKTRKQP
jgi:transketolase